MTASAADFLLVEDNPDDAELTLRALQLAIPEARVDIARDGVQALEYLSHRLPRVLLLDLKLPRMDGEDVLRSIKGDRTRRRPPVVVFTSSQESADVRRCYELGANSYIVKPLDPQEFVRVVGAVGVYWLSLNQSPV